MKLIGLSAGAVDWSRVPEITNPGESGIALARTVALDDIRLRQVTYSAGYRADHWCDKGHLVFVVSGAVTVEQADGVHQVTAGMSYHVGDGGKQTHRLSSVGGATLFIVD